MLKKLLNNKKGTAEVIGSVMFIVILLFFFTSVYLWHDAAVKDMNDLQVRRMNAGMEVVFSGGSANITAHGSEVVLSRIWIIVNSNDNDNNKHAYADLEASNIHLKAGIPIQVKFDGGSITDGKIGVTANSDVITLHYSANNVASIKVLNTLGIVS
jgi:hypothetical protein